MRGQHEDKGFPSRVCMFYLSLCRFFENFATFVSDCTTYTVLMSVSHRYLQHITTIASQISHESQIMNNNRNIFFCNLHILSLFLISLPARVWC